MAAARQEIAKSPGNAANRRRNFLWVPRAWREGLLHLRSPDGAHGAGAAAIEEKDSSRRARRARREFLGISMPRPRHTNNSSLQQWPRKPRTSLRDLVWCGVSPTAFSPWFATCRTKWFAGLKAPPEAGGLRSPPASGGAFKSSNSTLLDRSERRWMCRERRGISRHQSDAVR